MHCKNKPILLLAKVAIMTENFKVKFYFFKVSSKQKYHNKYFKIYIQLLIEMHN